MLVYQLQHVLGFFGQCWESGAEKLVVLITVDCTFLVEKVDHWYNVDRSTEFLGVSRQFVKAQSVVIRQVTCMKGNKNISLPSFEHPVMTKWRSILNCSIYRYMYKSLSLLSQRGY